MSVVRPGPLWLLLLLLLLGSGVMHTTAMEVVQDAPSQQQQKGANNVPNNAQQQADAARDLYGVIALHHCQLDPHKLFGNFPLFGRSSRELGMVLPAVLDVPAFPTVLFRLLIFPSGDVYPIGKSSDFLLVRQLPQWLFGVLTPQQRAALVTGKSPSGYTHRLAVADPHVVAEFSSAFTPFDPTRPFVVTVRPGDLRGDNELPAPCLFRVIVREDVVALPPAPLVVGNMVSNDTLQISKLWPELQAAVDGVKNLQDQRPCQSISVAYEGHGMVAKARQVYRCKLPSGTYVYKKESGRDSVYASRVAHLFGVCAPRIGLVDLDKAQGELMHRIGFEEPKNQQGERLPISYMTVMDYISDDRKVPHSAWLQYESQATQAGLLMALDMLLGDSDRYMVSNAGNVVSTAISDPLDLLPRPRTADNDNNNGGKAKKSKSVSPAAAAPVALGRRTQLLCAIDNDIGGEIQFKTVLGYLDNLLQTSQTKPPTIAEAAWRVLVTSSPCLGVYVMRPTKTPKSPELLCGLTVQAGIIEGILRAIRLAPVLRAQYALLPPPDAQYVRLLSRTKPAFLGETAQLNSFLTLVSQYPAPEASAALAATATTTTTTTTTTSTAATAVRAAGGAAAAAATVASTVPAKRKASDDGGGRRSRKDASPRDDTADAAAAGPSAAAATDDNNTAAAARLAAWNLWLPVLQNVQDAIATLQEEEQKAQAERRARAVASQPTNNRKKK